MHKTPQNCTILQLYCNSAVISAITLFCTTLLYQIAQNMNALTVHKADVDNYEDMDVTIVCLLIGTC